MKTWRYWQAYCTKRYDVLVVLGITLLVFSLSGFFNMYEWFTIKTRYLERWQIDERSSVAERYDNFTRKYRYNVVAHIPLEQPDETPDTVPAR